MNRKEAVAISTRKWEYLAKGKVPRDFNCGFCDYFGERCVDNEDNAKCQDCPLFPDICADYNEFDTVPLYWQYHGEQGMAEQILKAIKERGKIWIEEE